MNIRLLLRIKKLVAPLMLLLFLIIPDVSDAQNQTSRSVAPGQYYLTTQQGDTLHLKGETPFYDDWYSAITDGHAYADEHDVEVYLRQRPLLIRSYSELFRNDEEVREKEDQLPVFENLNLEITERFDADDFEILSTAVSYADSVEVQKNCVERDTRIWKSWPNGVFLHRFNTSCMNDMSITYRFFKDGVAHDTTEYIPGFFFTGDFPEHEPEFEIESESSLHFFEDFSDPNPDEWESLWGELQWSFQAGRMIVDLPVKNQARVWWNLIPEHRDIRYRIVEEVHASFPAGTNIGGRSSKNPGEHSVETQLRENGMEISFHNSGTRINPATFPLDWSYGELIEYTVTISDDSVLVDINGEQFSYRDQKIGNSPPGMFALGSNESGLFILHEIEVEIFD